MNAAARRSGRRPEDITLVAVTKTVPFERLPPFLEAGIRYVGENRVQEALAKYQNPDGSKRVPAELHLIGPLQSNKAKKAAAFFDMIQTLDRAELAEDLNRHAADQGRRVACLLEVKISPEPSKRGLEPARVLDFIERIKRCGALEVQGLMGMAPLHADPRPYFRALRALFEKAELKILSMGMSGDFEAAIEEGATMVRIGSALFGERPLPA